MWAQDELVSAYLPLVYNIVGRALNGHADVDDVVQESMLRALRGLGSLRDTAGFRSWLVAITMNQIRTYWHKRQATPVDSELRDAYDVADPGADFVDLTIVRLRLEGERRELARATRWLGTDDRALLSLWWLEAAGELSRAEVAAALELSPEHTGVRIQRMKAQLDTARLVVRALAVTPSCARLDEVTGNWDGHPSALWRKRIARHVRECAHCSGHQAGLVPAEGLLVGLGLVPVAAATGLTFAGGPEGVGEPVAFADAGAAAATVVSGSGVRGGEASVPPGRRGRRVQERIRRRRRATGIAVGIAVLAGGAAVVGLKALPSDGEADTVRSASAPELSTPSAPPPSTSSKPSTSPSPSPSLSPSSSPKPSPTRTKPKPKPKPTRESALSPTPTLAPTPTKTAKAKPAPARASTPAGQVLAIVNAERAKAGCGALKHDDRLARAAQLHSEDMSANNYFDHTSQDGRSFSDRATAQGYPQPGAENIARGQNSPEAVMSAWMNSPGHRANILNCSLNTMGVGLVDDDWTWTQVFGF
ncbi:sigma-70 family RNA polymerase sigma factor [Streptomyces apocyni]|uniref:sigma-70 family RNA polymerase sigma factor n=1 Tax=Streptomyces apocyni TaxID=2654677 RepID=UPI0012E9B048|nr:sigma-70 family RNA polymerase sigma factor [Streptomyces apocyni]